MASLNLQWESLSSLPKFLFGDGEKGFMSKNTVVSSYSASSFHANTTSEAGFQQRALSAMADQVSIGANGVVTMEGIASSRVEVSMAKGNFVDRNSVNCVDRLAVGSQNPVARITRQSFSSESCPNIAHRREIADQPSNFHCRDRITTKPLSHPVIEAFESDRRRSSSVKPATVETVTPSLQRARSSNNYNIVSTLQSPITPQSSSAQRPPTFGDARRAKPESLNRGEDKIVKKTRNSPSHKQTVGKVLRASKVAENIRCTTRQEGSLKSFLSPKSSFSGDLSHPPTFLGRYRTSSTPELKYKTRLTCISQHRLKGRSTSLTNLKHQPPPSRRLLHLDVGNHNSYVPLETPRGIIHLNTSPVPSRQQFVKIPVLTPNLIFLIERTNHVPLSRDQVVSQSNSQLRLRQELVKNRPIQNLKIDSPLTMLSMGLPSEVTTEVSGTTSSSPEVSVTSSANENSPASSASGDLDDEEIDGPMGTPPNSATFAESAYTIGPILPDFSSLVIEEANFADDSSSIEEQAIENIKSGKIEPIHPASAPGTASKSETSPQQSLAHSTQAGVLHTLEQVTLSYEPQAAEATTEAALAPLVAVAEPHLDGPSFCHLPPTESADTTKGHVSPTKSFNRRTIQTSAVANYGSDYSAGGQASAAQTKQVLESNGRPATNSFLQCNVNDDEESASQDCATGSYSTVHHREATFGRINGGTTNGNTSPGIFERRPSDDDTGQRTIASVFDGMAEYSNVEAAAGPSPLGYLMLPAPILGPRRSSWHARSYPRTPHQYQATYEDLQGDARPLPRFRAWLRKWFAPCLGTPSNSDDASY